MNLRRGCCNESHHLLSKKQAIRRVLMAYLNLGFQVVFGFTGELGAFAATAGVVRG
jgi:hypothetical protein